MSESAQEMTRVEPRMALLHTEGWSGRQQQWCVVIGETPKRYRVRAVVGSELRLPLRGNGIRKILPSGSALVPKSSVTFEVSPAVGRDSIAPTPDAVPRAGEPESSAAVPSRDLAALRTLVERLTRAIDWFATYQTPPRPTPSAWGENEWVEYWRANRTDHLKAVDESRMFLDRYLAARTGEQK